MAMLAFTVAVLLLLGIGLIVAAVRRAAAPGPRIDLDIPTGPPNRPSGDQG